MAVLGRMIGGGLIVAQILALVGIAGIVGESVTRRTREIGVRMALGARALHVSWTIARESVVTGLLGLGAGVLLIFFLQEWVTSVVFDYYVTRLGPEILSIQVLGFAIGSVALLALSVSLLSARRALSIDPVEALRVE